ncbi:MAG: extracellular solute-binding protein [Acholeplasmataceae bacterium]|nr:extracellular solute-binding protein [Acholeplasmataceae bacterium]
MKKLFSILTIVLLVFILVGCRGGKPTDEDDDIPGQKVSLKYWNSLTGADGTVMRQLVQQFNAAHQGEIEVIETFNNEIDYYTNINLLVPMGQGPDVMIMHSYLVQSYANSNILVPIDDYLEVSEVDIHPEDYVEDVFGSLYFNDALYGVPLDLHAVGIYYNKTLLDKYDLDVPTNRDELIATAKTVQTGEKVETPNFWGLPISTVWPSEWLFTTALYQNNGLEIDAEGNPAYNTSAGAAALKAVADFIHVEQISPTNLSVDQDLFMFQTGRALFHMQGSWMLNSIIDSGINFGVIPMSNMFNMDGETYSEQIAARSHTFVVPTRNTPPSDERKEAVMTFIKYLGDHSYVWATAGQIPASNIARSSSEYQALEHIHGFGEIDNFRVAAQSPYYHQAFSPVYSRVTAALSNASYNASTLLTAAVAEAIMLIAEAKS